MPALPPVPKVIRFDLLWTLAANARVADRFFLQYSGALSTADLTTVINKVLTQWGLSMSGQQSTVIAMTQVKGTDLTSNTAPQVIVTGSVPGTAAGTSLTSATAAVVRFKIARRYRGGHPRFYLGGLIATQTINNNQLTSGAAAAISSAFSAFISNLVTAPPAAVGTLTHVNVSYFSGFTNKTFPSGRTKPVPTLRGAPVIDSVLTYSTNIQLGSQRRRNQQSA